ncbi:MAG TPA: YaiI/YqxD family protein, partial [Clostridia bacterium]|nr:YaiI/YqxD family protein [Clostridia bacterium]
MKILVDADACPVKDIIIRIAGVNGIKVVMFIDTSHILNYETAEIVTVDKARDSVDIALTNRTNKGDIVVTQDYGVAAMSLAKGAYAINQNGLIYNESNMDRLLFERHLSGKLRRSGAKSPSMKKRTKENDECFRKAFTALIDN